MSAGCGGSNGYRSRDGSTSCNASPTSLAWRSRSATFRPETSKWNKIEHRLFSQITHNWRARPLVSHEVVVNLIANEPGDRVPRQTPSEGDPALLDPTTSLTPEEEEDLRIFRSSPQQRRLED